MSAYRVAAVFAAAAVVLAAPLPWATTGVRPVFACSTVAMLLVALLFLAHGIMERVAPAPHEPFVPTDRARPTADPKAPAPAPVETRHRRAG